MENLRERLAETQHNIWVHWMTYLFNVSHQNIDGTYTIPLDKVLRWKHQMFTAYYDLSAQEMDSDREQADKILEIIKPDWIATPYCKIGNEIEKLILSYSSRGIDGMRQAIRRGYCERAAQLILDNRGSVLIGTGFPVKGTFETDGPIGAIALYQVLKHIGYSPIITCPPMLTKILKNDFPVYEIPILPWNETIPSILNAFEQLNPSLIISIEQPGVSRDGHYYNMRKQCITDLSAKSDLFFRLSLCPTIAFGDGGNEIGMGNIYQQLLSLPINPSVTTCTELILSTVSNWGVYGLIAMLSYKLDQDLFTFFNPELIAHYLVKSGGVDGVTGRSEATEDNFPISTGIGIISKLRELLNIVEE